MASSVTQSLPYRRVTRVDAGFLERCGDAEELMQPVREDAREKRFRMNCQVGLEREARLAIGLLSSTQPIHGTGAILEHNVAIAPWLQPGTDQARRVHIARALEEAAQVDPPDRAAAACLEVARERISPELADSAPGVAYLKGCE